MNLIKSTSGLFKNDLYQIPLIELDFDSMSLCISAGSLNCERRARRILQDEPETVRWVESLKPSDVLYDVGANIGVYTLVAARAAGCRVVALEPSALNYSELVKNLYLNDLSKKTIALCLAAWSEVSLSVLHMSYFAPGFSHNDFSTNWWDGPQQIGNFLIDQTKRPVQHCLGMPIDDLVEKHGLPQPTHIKIDVDGLEPNVVAGAKKVLADDRLKSLLIEIDLNLDSHRTLLIQLKELGFYYDEEQVRQSKSQYLDDNVFRMKMSENSFKGNFIFYRHDG